MSEEVEARIREAISRHGPITFAEFMEHALYGPGGFYERPPIGERGHFVTSPHVHYVFATLLAKALQSFWTGAGRPVPFHLIEVGAGDGTLARRLLTELEPPVRYVAIDRSPGARAALAKLPVRVAPSLEMIEAHSASCVFANELLDNLPFEWVRQTPQGPLQVFVGVSAGRLVPHERPWPKELLDLLPDLTPGEEAAVPVEGLRFVERAVKVLSRGYVLLIDYGAGRTAQVHGYREHRVVADVLEDPGSADITAGVDLERLARHAQQLGLHTLGPFSQRSTLLALGIADWFQEQRNEQVALLERREGREAIRTFGGRSRASLLVDPAGLGSLNWMVFSSPDCDWPPWALEAAESGPS